jgi:pilus assembly protein CpaB
MGRRTLLLIASILVAAVGTALIGLYVRGADERARETEGMVDALVAVSAIPAGASLEAASPSIKLASVPARLAVNGYTGPDAMESFSQYAKDRKVINPILPQQVIQKSMFGSPGDAATSGITRGRGVAVELTDPARAAGLLAPGSRVTVYLVPDPEDDVKQEVKILPNGRLQLAPQLSLPIILNDALVMRVGNSSSTPATASARTTTTAQPDDVPRTIVTLDLSPDDTTKVVSAQAFGDLYFAVNGDES